MAYDKKCTNDVGRATEEKKNGVSEMQTHAQERTGRTYNTRGPKSIASAGQ